MDRTPLVAPATILLLAGCAAAPTPEQVASEKAAQAAVEAEQAAKDEAICRDGRLGVRHRGLCRLPTAADRTAGGRGSCDTSS
jgi:hypothetical protein